MRGQLTFDLEEHEDKARFEAIATDAHGKLKSAMSNFAQEVLRKYRKHGGLARAVGLSPASTVSAEDVAQLCVERIEKMFYEELEDQEASIE